MTQHLAEQLHLDKDTGRDKKNLLGSIVLVTEQARALGQMGF